MKARVYLERVEELAEQGTRNSSVHVEAPFSGYKQSGLGRELGRHALNLYTEVKNIFISLS